ncbi:MAG: YbaB/EbfC family nucleoid-associated protein, partial [Blautia sp.]|nr:YbaB/EbfC family nucleoid-associated protein [Blautia sp.]
AKRGGFGGMGMGMPANMNNLMKQAQKLQKQMEDSKKELEEKEFTGTAGGGAVTATMNGKRELLSLTIQPEVVDPDDIEMLQDLIVAALNNVLSSVEESSAELMNSLGGGLGGLGGGLGGGFPF